MIEEINKQNIFLLGDTHNFPFINYWSNLKNLENFVLIAVGDIGIGFGKFENDKRIIDILNKTCERYNGLFLAIRGNHDNPAVFLENSPYNTEFVKFLPDYTYKVINGEKFLFVGGATSIDRIDNTLNVDYWKDETFVLPEDYKRLDECDVLVTHSCPDFCQPIGGLEHIRYYLDRDPPLEAELMKERKEIGLLYKQVLPKKAYYYGHFHRSHIEYIDNVLHRCLNINELVEYKR